MTFFCLALILLGGVFDVSAYTRTLQRGLRESTLRHRSYHRDDLIIEEVVQGGQSLPDDNRLKPEIETNTQLKSRRPENDKNVKLKSRKRNHHVNEEEQPINGHLDSAIDVEKKATASRRPLGFPLVKSALQHYKMLYGNMLVPVMFTVPSDGWGWPSEMWNVKLGIVVQTIRRGSYANKRDELLGLGFCYDVSQVKYASVLSTLIAYKSIYGNLLVPQQFKVPLKGDAWPDDSLSMKLGSIVNSIRSGIIYCNHRDELLKIGFVYEAPLKCSWDTFKLALLRYVELHNHSMVAEAFVVPRNSTEWPKVTWGLRLGATANNVRRNFAFKNKKEELLALGFCYDLKEVRFHALKAALIHYKKLHGNLLIPTRYVVPSNYEWPNEMWDVNMGAQVHGIRKGFYKDKKAELLEIGFVYAVRKKFEYEDVKIAVFKYREYYHGSTDIPPVYNIPFNDPWYPKETWGLCLGSYASRIRKGYIWSDKASELFQ